MSLNIIAQVERIQILVAIKIEQTITGNYQVHTVRNFY